jgi:hypothetical protein
MAKRSAKTSFMEGIMGVLVVLVLVGAGWFFVTGGKPLFTAQTSAVPNGGANPAVSCRLTSLPNLAVSFFDPFNTSDHYQAAQYALAYSSAFAGSGAALTSPGTQLKTSGGQTTEGASLQSDKDLSIECGANADLFVFANASAQGNSTGGHFTLGLIGDNPSTIVDIASTAVLPIYVTKDVAGVEANWTITVDGGSATGVGGGILVTPTLAVAQRDVITYYITASPVSGLVYGDPFTTKGYGLVYVVDSKDTNSYPNAGDITLSGAGVTRMTDISGDPVLAKISQKFGGSQFIWTGPALAQSTPYKATHGAMGTILYGPKPKLTLTLSPSGANPSTSPIAYIAAPLGWYQEGGFAKIGVFDSSGTLKVPSYAQVTLTQT